ncbi:MAG: hypothetical protein H8E98_00920 [Bacteroidetes bacterium]|nr:hypothetical protein [Bacteroidota bacterium]
MINYKNIKITFVAILAFLINLSAYSQYSKLSLTVINKLGPQREFIVNVESHDTCNIKNSFVTDSLGYYRLDSIPFGVLLFKIIDDSNQCKIYIIKIDKDSYELKFNVPSCDTINLTGICPICNKKDEVVLIQRQYVVSNPQFKNARQQKQYYRKRNRKEYLIVDNRLEWVKDEEQMKKLHNSCYHWFCKRDKIVF